jgi:hypothetical protein
VWNVWPPNMSSAAACTQRAIQPCLARLGRRCVAETRHSLTDSVAFVRFPNPRLPTPASVSRTGRTRARFPTSSGVGDGTCLRPHRLSDPRVPHSPLVSAGIRTKAERVLSPVESLLSDHRWCCWKAMAGAVVPEILGTGSPQFRFAWLQFAPLTEHQPAGKVFRLSPSGCSIIAFPAGFVSLH